MKFCRLCLTKPTSSTRAVTCSEECRVLLHRKHQKKYRDANKQLTSERNKRYHEANPDAVKSKHYKARYGISLEEAKQLLENQGNCCAICNKQLDFYAGVKGRDKPVVDHCHTTNKVRGILCTNCNLLLGYSFDKTTTLETAITYLEKYHQNTTT